MLVFAAIKVLGLNPEVNNMKQPIVALSLFCLLVACGSDDSNPAFSSKAQLGEQLYNDKNLSLNRSQSCATCHNPNQGFIDERVNDASINGLASAGSLGDNGTSIGDRNAPTVAYAAFSPSFKPGTRERAASQRTGNNPVADYQGFLGGQFWDGREDDLAGQAGGPPTNPDEMGMPDKASVIERLKENADYVSGFESLYGSDIFNDTDNAYLAMTDSIGEFEKTSVFYPFDSKYDRSLIGEYSYPVTSKAVLGKALFFSSDFACASCHQLHEIGNKGEIFTSFEYHNIGVPENTALRSFNGVTQQDLGLFNNPNGATDDNKGKFKVPTLRNVAVTAPYMHNGVFQTLEAVLHFYEHAKLRGRNNSNGSVINDIINPETHLGFKDPEVDLNIEHELLAGNDKNLDPQNIEALVCFFMSLTDAKFEHLLDVQKVKSCGL